MHDFLSFFFFLKKKKIMIILNISASYLSNRSRVHIGLVQVHGHCCGDLMSQAVMA